MARSSNTRTSPEQPSRRNRQPSEPADWGTVTPEVIHTLVASVTAIGGAVRFGYSRDGGAYSIGILGDGEPYTEYFRPNDDIDARLLQMASEFR